MRHKLLAVLMALPMLAVGQVQPRSGADIAASVSAATVGIRARQADGSEFAGSGFLVDAAGTIITNFHVVENSTFVEVRLSNDDVYPVIGIRAVDQRRDLAVLQVAGFKLPLVRLGDSNSVKPGERVMVVGNALGLLDNSVTAGIVSGIRDAGGYRLIQMDAAISRGNSGGPVVNERGEVVGVATLKLRDGESLNFAVPINYARGLLQLPVERGLGMLANNDVDDTHEIVAPSKTSEQSTNSKPFPVLWRSLTTGNIKRIQITGDRMFVEYRINPALRDAGAASIANLRKSGEHWVGIHSERVNCRPMPLTRRRVCPAIEMPITISLLSSDRIEGTGEEPLNEEAFDCRRCQFVEPPRAKPFIWVPE
jgi:S1-C subfamily serine protease